MRKPRGRANAIDAHVGSRIRTRRTLLGLNQTQLGETLGISFQQLQKYERGSNRISAGRLYHLSKFLDVPVSYFYEDMPDELVRKTLPGKPPPRDESEADTMHRRETLELVRAYYRIKSDKARKRIFELIKTIAKAGDTE